MNKIAQFEKVSFEQFEKDWLKCFPDTENVKEIYDSIKLPKRATTGSAGYDFYARESGLKSMTDGCFVFFLVRVLDLSTEFSLTIQSESLMPIITTHQMKAILWLSFLATLMTTDIP